MLKSFYNKKGELTKYGLACGYIQKFEKMGNSITLWMEHGCLHVRQYNHVQNKRIFWESFDNNLTNARKRFNKAVKTLESCCFVPQN